MYSKSKATACLVGASATWLSVIAATSSVADETFAKSSTITSVSTKAFDIGFVDPVAGVYVLADRTNKAIDVIDTATNTLINQLMPGFVGVSPKGNDFSGPDGVLIVDHTHVWVGDGNSTVWVLDLHTGKVEAKISTALPGTTDPTRADELCTGLRKIEIKLSGARAPLAAPTATGGIEHHSCRP